MTSPRVAGEKPKLHAFGFSFLSQRRLQFQIQVITVSVLSYDGLFVILYLSIASLSS